MSESPPKVEPASEQLLEKLRDTPSRAVSQKVATVDRLTPEEEDGHGRWLKSQKTRLVNKLFSWFMHFLFVVVCILVLAIAGGGIYLTAKWIMTFQENAEKLEAFLSDIWNFGLIALATLFINGLFGKDS